MKNSVKITVLLIACIISVFTAAEISFAESAKYNGSAYFDGKAVRSSFRTGEIADAVSELEPGDDVSFKVKYTNKYKEDTEWYLENEVLQTLEKADAARKIPEGTGTPENGGYTYELIHKDKNGKKTVLFSNDRVGGDARPDDMQGLEQATNALDDWFYIQTLGKGESGELTLNVKFDGETEVNDYMDTNGGLMLRLGVNVKNRNESSSQSSPSSQNESDGPEYSQGIRTGDPVRLGLFAAMFAAGIILLIVIWRRMKSEQGGEA